MKDEIESFELGNAQWEFGMGYGLERVPRPFETLIPSTPSPLPTEPRESGV